MLEYKGESRQMNNETSKTLNQWWKPLKIEKARRTRLNMVLNSEKKNSSVSLTDPRVEEIIDLTNMYDDHIYTR